MHYASVFDAARLVQQLGQGAMLAKMDLHHAYRVLLVHTDDHPLLGIQWDSGVYVDRAMPFGLRSAPKIFSAFADALAWVLKQEGVVHQIHYLDDFLFVGSPQSPLCKQALAKALALCKHLHVPVAMHKTEGPATQLTFLGIQSTQQSWNSVSPRTNCGA